MAKLNVDKALAKGFTPEQIRQFVRSRPDLELEGVLPMSKMDLALEATKLPMQGVEILGEKAKGLLPKSMTMEGMQADPSPSTAMNFLRGLPETVIDTASEIGQEFTSPTSLATMALAGPAVKGVAGLTKMGAKGAGSLLSGVKAGKVGRLFEDPGALVAGAKEMLTKGAQKGFKAAKEASGIRSLAKGKSVVQTPSEALKELSTSRKAVADVLRKARKSGVADRESMGLIKQSAEEANKLGQATLEARQALGDLSKAKQVMPETAALRNRLNASLNTLAPAVRAADAPMSRALLGKEFMSVVPRDLLRRVISFGGIGGGFVNPAFASGAVATAPITTGLMTAGLGAGAKVAKAATSTPLRRAIIGALLTKREERNAQ